MLRLLCLGNEQSLSSGKLYSVVTITVNEGVHRPKLILDVWSPLVTTDDLSIVQLHCVLNGIFVCNQVAFFVYLCILVFTITLPTKNKKIIKNVRLDYIEIFLRHFVIQCWEFKACLKVNHSRWMFLPRWKQDQWCTTDWPCVPYGSLGGETFLMQV